jgi:beta-phosphoglucomutase
MRTAGNIQGVVFDLDGVLIHSTATHASAFQEVLSEFGIGDFDYTYYAGWRTPEVIMAEFRRCDLSISPEIIHAAAARKTLLARRKLAETNPVDADCLEVLVNLSQSYRLALASSGSGGSLRSFLELNSCNGFFLSVLTGDDIVSAKPHPEIYRRTFHALNLGPGDCVVIEDAVAGIEAARCAGGIAIGVTGTCSAEALLTAGAAHVLDSIRSLPNLLLTM